MLQVSNAHELQSHAVLSMPVILFKLLFTSFCTANVANQLVYQQKRRVGMTCEVTVMVMMMVLTMMMMMTMRMMRMMVVVVVVVMTMTGQQGVRHLYIW